MIPYDKRRLGEYLKSKREAANLTQYIVAEELGYTSPQFISNIERGISVAPLKTLSRMLKLYKASTDGAAEIILDGQREFMASILKGNKSSAKKRTPANRR